MEYTTDERVELIFIYAKTGMSLRRAAQAFQDKFPQRPKPAPITISRLVKRFRQTGSVRNQRPKGYKKNATSEETTTAVLALAETAPHMPTRKMAAASGISQSSVLRILKAEKYHPYKMQILHMLHEDDFDRRVEFCTWALNKLEDDPVFACKILFSDECLFYLNGTVNRQNCRYWAQTNPHWMLGAKTMNDERIMVWCGMLGRKIIGPYFFPGTVSAQSYLDMLNSFLMDFLDDLPLQQVMDIWFMQDGAAPHYALSVRNRLTEIFPRRWIGRRGPVEWPPRSPDLTPMDYSIWGFVKSQVYYDPPTSLDDLKFRITEALNSITAEMSDNILRHWSTRLDLCVVNNGEHIEHLL